MEWIKAETNGVGVVVTNRNGGVSKPPYQSFNLAYHVGDHPAVVQENRSLLAKSMGLELSQLCFMEQVHGTEVVEVSPGMNPPTCDAMITNHHQLALLVMTADCVPILFYDPQNKAIGVAHAGWKGTVGRIAAKTLSQMKNRYGTNPENLLVYFGPSIRECCYEIGDVVKQAVITNFSAPQKYLFTRDNKTYFDLILCNRDVLVEMGVNPQNIVQNKVCVACHSKHYFSYRATGGITGRQVTGLWIKEDRKFLGFFSLHIGYLSKLSLILNPGMIHFYHIIIRLLQLAKNPKMGVMPVFFCLKANFSSSFCILNLFQYKAWFSIRPFLYLLSGGLIPCYFTHNLLRAVNGTSMEVYP